MQDGRIWHRSLLHIRSSVFPARPAFIRFPVMVNHLEFCRDKLYHLAYLPDSRSITIHSLILHNAFIHILLLLRQWCSVYQINSCCFAHVPPPSLSKIPMWMYCVFFFCIDCRQNPVPVHESPLDTVKSKSSAYLINRRIHLHLLFTLLHT